jgi:transcription termination factor Rho
MSPPEAMEQLIARMRRTKTNAELVAQIASGRV